MVKEKIENETKEQKFRRIASARANRILDDLRLLGNCSNKSAYGYSEAEVKKIFSTIEKETMDLIKVPTEEYLSFSRALRW